MNSPVVVITGPTGVGKTETALRVASQLNAQILSADSRQLYRRLDIGTAKPTPAQRQCVPHHLLDLIDPEQRFSAGEFGRRARETIQQLQDQQTPVVMVGGSGMYIEATIDGLGSGPRSDPALRSHLEARWASEGAHALYNELSARDPALASRLHVSDRSRVLRALELMQQSGRGVAPAPLRQETGYPPLLIALTRPREELHRRIEQRLEQMMSRGWLAEVEALLREGVPPNCPGVESLGYGELIAHVQQNLSISEALEQIARRTRQYAKRQMTWFRRDRRYRWLDLSRFGQRGVVDRIIDQWHLRARAFAR